MSIQRNSQLWQAILVVSISSALTLPALVYGQSGSPASSHSKYDLAPTEFFTQAERDLVERIRQRPMEDRALAAYAQTLEITAEEGRVTLRGMVQNEQEKAHITAKVQQTDGVTEVDGQLQTASGTAGL